MSARLLLPLVTSLFLAAPVPSFAETRRLVDELHNAAREGDLEQVRSLLDQGAELEATNPYGATTLMVAATWGHVDVCRELLVRGAEVNRQDTLYGANALIWASDRGHDAVVALLLEHGAEPSAALFTALQGEIGSALESLVATGQIPQDLLDAALSRATLTQSPLAGILQKAGGRLPPLSSYRPETETLAIYVGRYGYEEQRTYPLEVALVGTNLELRLPGEEPVLLEALDDVRFRQPRSTFFELRFETRDGSVIAAVLDQANRPQPFRFLREAPPSDATPEPIPPSEPSQRPSRPLAVEPEVEPKTEPTPVSAIPQGAAGRHWPGFRGPGTKGTGRGRPAVAWREEDRHNILWKNAIPGRSFASPIVWNDRIFLTTAVSLEGEEAFPTENSGSQDFVESDAIYRWGLMALDRMSGKALWTATAHEGRARARHHIKASQFNATPATDGRYLVAVMGSEGLFCYDLEGRLLWRRDLGKLNVGWFYDEGFEWGHASSPLLLEDRVLVQVDRSRDPYLAAFALEDGRELWRTPRDNLPSWGTPALIQGSEGWEIVTNGSPRIRGYDAKTGTELWNLGPHSQVTVGSVVTGHGLAFVVGNWRPIRAIYAIRPGGRGDISLPEGRESSPHIPWRHTRGGTYVPTPLVYGDTLYTLSNRGILSAYRAQSGEEIYRHRVGQGGSAFSASPVAADGRLYLAAEDGDVFVVRHGREFELLAHNEINEVILATPALSDDLLFIRTLDHIYAIGTPSTEDVDTLKIAPPN